MYISAIDVVVYQLYNTLRPRQNCRHFTRIFLNENVWISLKISLKFVSWVRISNTPSLVQIIALCRSGDKPLPEPMYRVDKANFNGLLYFLENGVHIQMITFFSVISPPKRIYIYIYMYTCTHKYTLCLYIHVYIYMNRTPISSEHCFVDHLVPPQETHSVMITLPLLH